MCIKRAIRTKHQTLKNGSQGKISKRYIKRRKLQITAKKINIAERLPSMTSRQPCRI